MKIRSFTWYLLPAEIVVLVFVLFFHPRYAALQGLEDDPNKPPWEKIESGMSPLRVIAIMGREPEDTILPHGDLQYHVWVEKSLKIRVEYFGEQVSYMGVKHWEEKPKKHKLPNE